MYDATSGSQFQPAPQNTAAGWYPDPHVAGTMRYWDGEAWSEHVATGYDHPAPSVAVGAVLLGLAAMGTR